MSEFLCRPTNDWKGVFELLEKKVTHSPKEKDSVFQLIIDAQINWENCIVQLEQIFEDQHLSGGLFQEKHLIEEGFLAERTIYPPIFGIALWLLLNNNQAQFDKLSFLRKYYYKIVDYHRFLYEFRDLEENGIICIRNNKETLFLDHQNSPKKCDADFLSQPPNNRINWIQDPFFNSLLVWSNECLIKLGRVLEEDLEEVMSWHECTIHTMDEILWQSEKNAYFPIDLNHNSTIEVNEITSLIPIAGEVPIQEQAELLFKNKLSRLFQNNIHTKSEKSTTVFGMNGSPVSLVELIVAYWFIYIGLEKYGLNSEAKKLRKKALMKINQTQMIHSNNTLFEKLDAKILMAQYHLLPSYN